MDKHGEVANRWHRVFEKLELVEQQEALSHIPDPEIIGDVRFLFDTIKDLEEKLSNAQNPYASQVGKTVLWENGDLFYMLQGKYVTIKCIVTAFSLLKELVLRDKGPTKTQKEVFDSISKEFGYEDTEKKRETDQPS